MSRTFVATSSYPRLSPITSNSWSGRLLSRLHSGTSDARSWAWRSTSGAKHRSARESGLLVEDLVEDPQP